MEASPHPALLVALLLLAVVPPAPRQSTEYGPERGTLVLAGGGPLDEREILGRFVELGGGAEDGRFVIVPTARGNFRSDGSPVPYDEDRWIAPWKELGVRHVSMLHTHDATVADTPEFVAPLREATAVWFGGGRQWNIVDSYAGTLTYDEFHAVLARGGVIGGSSAGATIQGEYLVRGDTSGPQIVMTDEVNHQRGFEFLRRSAIDQHVDTRNRWDDLIPVLDAFPELIGIGLSENTAIVVTGDTFEVVGSGRVAVHQRTPGADRGEDPYFLLAPGDVYDMRARRLSKVDDPDSLQARAR